MSFLVLVVVVVLLLLFFLFFFLWGGGGDTDSSVRDPQHLRSLGPRGSSAADGSLRSKNKYISDRPRCRQLGWLLFLPLFPLLDHLPWLLRPGVTLGG